MKQHINKKQWDELSEGEKSIFNNTGLIDCTCSRCQENLLSLPNIGQMIEFLGDDLLITNDATKDFSPDWYVGEYYWHEKEWGKHFIKKELCDALWEAVKYKLRNESNS